ncbi:MAG: hypothetical protein ACFCUM_02135 [Bacteroidales bacterium]
MPGCPESGCLYRQWVRQISGRSINSILVYNDSIEKVLIEGGGSAREEDYQNTAGKSKSEIVVLLCIAVA